MLTALPLLCLLLQAAPPTANAEPQGSAPAAGAPAGGAAQEAAAAQAPAGGAAAEPAIRAPLEWARAQGPIQVEVTRPRGAPALELALLRADGTLVASAPIDAGIYDAAQMLPALLTVERAGWLQLLAGGAPVGTPLVVVPLRSPPPCRTVSSLRPDGKTRYTRVVGWGDKLLNEDDREARDAKAGWIAGDPVITSGFRILRDRDAVLHTDQGDVRVAMAPDAAPATVWNFLMLAESGFYDGTVFHRVVPLDREGRPFVVQGGDPTGSGDGGPGWNLALEPSTLQHDFGVISMARADEPHSAGCQFFLALSREGTARLDGQYAAFGYTVEGRAAIKRLADVEIADVSTGRPVTAPRLLSVELVPAPPRTPGVDRWAQRITRDPPLLPPDAPVPNSPR
ncbi:MAG: peptidylprolyl isomerase [Phycisphaerales bacterium]